MSELTRRQFLKVTGYSLVGSSLAIMGFSPEPALAEVREYKLTRATETRNTCPYCSVACGVLMYGLGDGAKNAQAEHLSYRGRSRSSGQSRHAVPEGRRPDRLHPQREPAEVSRVSRPGFRSLAAYFVGRRARSHREADEAGSRRELRRQDPGRADRQPVADHRNARRIGIEQRSRLFDAKGCALTGSIGIRQPGACVTRPDGGRSCPDVWPWSDDESLGRHQECRHRSHHGRQRRRSAPVRLQVGHRGEGAQQGQAHRR